MTTTNPREIGTLIAVILKARNLPNKRHIGKQDPYCSVSLNGEKRRTKAIRRGGQHPEWDEEVRFTVFEDLTGSDDVLRLDADDAPPPPPPKTGRSVKRIQGGNSMGIACYADDIREPDLIGEATVDLTEVLTKGETDEWFTLMHKDKYCGEVYLELTFWSNEPPPEKKSAPKPSKSIKHYGGPGSFVPSSDPSLGPGSRASSLNGDGEQYRRESLPSSLRSSSSQVNLDLYTPPYEQTIRAKNQRVTSVDQMTSDFGEFGFLESNNRSQSYPPNHDGRPRSTIDFPLSSSSSEPSDHGDAEPGYVLDRPATGQVQRYHRHSAPYEPAPAQPASHQPTRRGPRYSVPVSSSGFMPSRPGFAPPLSRTPVPTAGYAPPLPHTPAPSGYPAPSSLPASSSQHSQHARLTESPQSSFSQYSGYSLNLNPSTPPQFSTPPNAAAAPQTHAPGSRTLPQPPQTFGQPHASPQGTLQYAQLSQSHTYVPPPSGPHRQLSPATSSSPSVSTPPPHSHMRSTSGRPSLPLPQPPPGPPPREPPIYQPIPPPPAPPTLPSHSQLPAPPPMPPQGPNYPAYPGPPPRPPTLRNDAGQPQWSAPADPQQYRQGGYQIPAGRPGEWA
ncbi:hypothetical protein DENSPDRAFT_862261 [Dentipellis sp. KUC8613]|nr:hypothetical protein DENSPDRAFT_862261 [Dentipellis sp. KUC8613]